MDDPRFPIWGSSKPPMLGRSNVLTRIWSNLTKPTPSNLSIVGPRYVGKTIIMNALADKAACEESPYKFVLHWHLGHVPPLSDAELITNLCDLLRDILAASGGDYVDHQEYLGGHSYPFLKEVTDSLHSEGKAILMLWDGFDKPLEQDRLSRHLWDQMRAIFYGKRHKIVTATRRPLDELIRSQDAISSPFWNIFDLPPTRVEAFDDADCEAIIGMLSDFSFQTGAKSELRNWTSGYPPLFLEVLNQVIALNPAGNVDDKTVNAAAEGALKDITSLINDLWNDCSEPAKDVYRHLVKQGEMPTAVFKKLDLNQLAEKGFITQVGNKTRKACRLLERHICEIGQDSGILVSLFGSWDQYRSNIRGLLELRLNHLTHIDGRLRDLISRLIEDVPDYPHQCLTNMRGIVDRAFELIWKAEFGLDRKIPRDFVDYWRKSLPWWNDDKPLHNHLLNQDSCPTNRGFQCGLLQLLVGAIERVDSKAKHVSKSTYVLLNTVHTFGNLGQHFEGEDMHEGTAVVAIISCLELAACLDREL